MLTELIDIGEYGAGGVYTIFGFRYCFRRVVRVCANMNLDKAIKWEDIFFGSIGAAAISWGWPIWMTLGKTKKYMSTKDPEKVAAVIGGQTKEEKIMYKQIKQKQLMKDLHTKELEAGLTPSIPLSEIDKMGSVIDL